MAVKTNKSKCRSTIISVLAGCAIAFSISASARQLDDVTLPDTVTLDNTDVALQLNGMGYRTKFIFDVYVGALYTESKVGTRDEAQALTGPKRVLMHMVYDGVSHEKMADAWTEGFEENSSDEQFEKLSSRLKTLISYFPDLSKGDVITLDYIPGTGTVITVNGKANAAIEGADFYTALLDVWLGEEPADDDLKDAMLGDDKD